MDTSDMQAQRRIELSQQCGESGPERQQWPSDNHAPDTDICRPQSGSSLGS